MATTWGVVIREGVVEVLNLERRTVFRNVELVEPELCG